MTSRTVNPRPMVPTTLEAIKELIAYRHSWQTSRPPVNASAEVRRRYIDSSSHLSYPHMDHVISQITACLARHAASTRVSRWIALSGPYHSGKSECVQRLVLDFCNHTWNQTGEEIEDHQGRHLVIPAVYVPTAGGGERDLMRAIAAGLMLPEGLSPRTSDGAHDLLRRVANACRRSRTQVLVIDDVHLMSAGRGTHTTKFVKEMFSTLPVTLVAVGQDIDSTVLLKPRGSDPTDTAAALQMQRRVIRLRYDPVDANSPDGVREWAMLAKCVLAQLPLHSPKLDADTLTQLYLYAEGRRADLIEVLLIAASLAVGQNEQITPDIARQAITLCRSPQEEGSA